jgi:hypothetical protein
VGNHEQAAAQTEEEQAKVGVGFIHDCQIKEFAGYFKFANSMF